MRWLVIFLVACAAPQRAFAPADDQAIRGVLAVQAEAWNRGDLDGYMAGYAHSPELVFTSGGNIRRGYDETLAKYRAKYGNKSGGGTTRSTAEGGAKVDDKATMGTLAFELLSIQHLGADGAIVLGRWKLTNTPNAGGGVFSVAFERTSAGWRIVHDHTSADPPANPQPQPEQHP